jgi:superfamily II DNA or RNA helicase
MPSQERDDIIENFKKGKFQVLCNCMLLNEGWDMPDCDAVIMCRPTRSLSLYLQQCARCMRPGGKYDPIIVDMAWNFASFLRPEADRDWTLEGGAMKPASAAPGMKICEECGTVNVPTADTCCNPRCGADLKKHRILVPSERKKQRLQQMTEARIQEIEAWARKFHKTKDDISRIIGQEKLWLQD